VSLVPYRVLSHDDSEFARAVGWKARTEIVQYCVDVVDKGMDEKRAAFATEDSTLDPDARRRRHDALLYGEEVKVRSCLQL
jgi:hypothetical protein